MRRSNTTGDGKMGIMHLSQIPVWQDPCTSDPDAAELIGGADATQQVTLTRVFVNGAKVEFGEEEEGFQLWNGRPLEIRVPGTHPKDARQLLTIEIAGPKRDADGKKKNYRDHTAILSYRPSSVDWFGWSNFKSVTHDPYRAINELLRIAGTAASPESAIWSALGDMKTDPFGNENTFYARFRLMNRTDRPDWIGEEINDRISAGGRKANRKTSKLLNPRMALAISNEFPDCRERLESSMLLLDALSQAKAGIGKTHRGKPLRLATIAPSLADEIMRAAIIKALSGIDDKERASLKKNRKSTEHGMVAVLAHRLFHEDLRNLSKRTKHQGVITRVPDSEAHTPVPEIEEAAHCTKIDMEQAIQKKCKALTEKGQPPSSAAWTAIMQRLNKEFDNKNEQDAWICETCIYAAALAHFLSMPDQVIELLKTLRAEYSLYIEVVLGPEPEPEA
jgi:hypothetical protein